MFDLNLISSQDLNQHQDIEKFLVSYVSCIKGTEGFRIVVQRILMQIMLDIVIANSLKLKEVKSSFSSEKAKCLIPLLGNPNAWTFGSASYLFLNKRSKMLMLAITDEMTIFLKDKGYTLYNVFIDEWFTITFKISWL